MNYTDFKTHFQSVPLIKSQDAVRLAKDPQAMRNQLTRWQKKGLLIGLRKGMYVLNAHDRKTEEDERVVANHLYEPSYVSLECALNFYGLIPETVADVTSVTTRKTMRFHNPLGGFLYQHIQPRAFRGFRHMRDRHHAFFLAEPEKAVVDFLYLNLSEFNGHARDMLEHSYRFQNMEDLKVERLVEFGNLFGNKKLLRVIQHCVAWIQESNERR